MNVLTPKIKRVAVLWTHLSGYLQACLKTLVKKHDIELMVVYQPPHVSAPFEERQFDWVARRIKKTEDVDYRLLRKQVINFEPDIILLSGWRDKDYMRMLRKPPLNKVVRVSGLDNQWLNTPRQHLGILVAPYYLHPSIDCFWVCGDRQAQFAQRLGYAGKRLWRGLYCCDYKSFSEVYADRQNQQLPRKFLFVGRYVYEKGLVDMVKAYCEYRQRVKKPWELFCVGSGPLAKHLEEINGITNLGFVQPKELPAIFLQAGAFILPSRKEPWGLVLHEAAASGLPIIASSACGGTEIFLQDGYNGYIFTPGDVSTLSLYMERLSNLDNNMLLEMSRRSFELSKQITLERWADYFIEKAEDVINPTISSYS